MDSIEEDSYTQKFYVYLFQFFQTYQIHNSVTSVVDFLNDLKSNYINTIHSDSTDIENTFVSPTVCVTYRMLCATAFKDIDLTDSKIVMDIFERLLVLNISLIDASVSFPSITLSFTIGDCFSMLSIHTCEDVWSIVEKYQQDILIKCFPTNNKLKPQQDTNCSLAILKLIDSIVKRVSPNTNSTFYCRLLCFISSFFPIVHLSAWGKKVFTDLHITENLDTKDVSSSVFNSDLCKRYSITYNDYRDFWTLQSYLQNPTLVAVVPNDVTIWKTITKPLIESLLRLFDRFPITQENVLSTIGNTVVSASYLHFTKNPTSFNKNNTPYFSMSSSAFISQLQDTFLRKIILTQISILIFYLDSIKTIPNLRKEDKTDFSESTPFPDLSYLMRKITKILDSIEDDSTSFGSKIKTHLEREKNWLYWKTSTDKSYIYAKESFKEPELYLSKSSLETKYGKCPSVNINEMNKYTSHLNENSHDIHDLNKQINSSSENKDSLITCDYSKLPISKYVNLRDLPSSQITKNIGNKSNINEYLTSIKTLNHSDLSDMKTGDLTLPTPYNDYVEPIHDYIDENTDYDEKCLPTSKTIYNWRASRLIFQNKNKQLANQTNINYFFNTFKSVLAIYKPDLIDPYEKKCIEAKERKIQEENERKEKKRLEEERIAKEKKEKEEEEKREKDRIAKEEKEKREKERKEKEEKEKEKREKERKEKEKKVEEMKTKDKEEKKEDTKVNNEKDTIKQTENNNKSKDISSSDLPLKSSNESDQARRQSRIDRFKQENSTSHHDDSRSKSQDTRTNQSNSQGIHENNTRRTTSVHTEKQNSSISSVKRVYSTNNSNTRVKLQDSQSSASRTPSVPRSVSIHASESPMRYSHTNHGRSNSNSRSFSKENHDPHSKSYNKSVENTNTRHRSVSKDYSVHSNHSNHSNQSSQNIINETRKTSNNREPNHSNTKNTNDIKTHTTYNDYYTKNQISDNKNNNSSQLHSKSTTSNRTNTNETINRNTISATPINISNSSSVSKNPTAHNKVSVHRQDSHNEVSETKTHSKKISNQENQHLLDELKKRLNK